MQNKRLSHTRGIAHYICRRNPNDGQPLPSQPSIPPFIAGGMVTGCVREPVDLDGEPRGAAVKIQHVGTHRMLAAEPGRDAT
jgi:hypothetical protein